MELFEYLAKLNLYLQPEIVYFWIPTFELDKQTSSFSAPLRDVWEKHLIFRCFLADKQLP